MIMKHGNEYSDTANGGSLGGLGILQLLTHSPIVNAMSKYLLGKEKCMTSCWIHFSRKIVDGQPQTFSRLMSGFEEGTPSIFAGTSLKRPRVPSEGKHPVISARGT